MGKGSIYVHYQVLQKATNNYTPIPSLRTQRVPTCCFLAGMVNFNSPAALTQDALALTKLWHTVGGLYIWEYFTTLEYEWGVIRGRRPYRWTIWIYSVARVSALFLVVLGFVLMDNTAYIHCQVAITSETGFAFLTVSASSLLIVLRVIAVWNRNKVAVIAAIILWIINAAFFIQLIARLRFARLSGPWPCVPVNIESNQLNMIAMAVTDIALLLVMLVGLFRLRYYGNDMFGLTQFLWKQGIIWLLLALAAEIPPVVFLILNLNVPFDTMFQFPAYITMTIAATRLYRSLVDFTFSSTDAAHGVPKDSCPLVQESRRMMATSIPMDRVEVTVHIVSEQHVAPDDVSSIRTRDDILGKSNGMSSDRDVERGV